MTELHARFRSLDRVATPDLWDEIEERATATAPEPLGKVRVPSFPAGRVDLPRRHALRLALLLALLIVATIVLILAFGRQRSGGTTPLVFMSLTGSGPALNAVDIDSGNTQTFMNWTGDRLHLSPDGRYAVFDAVVGPEDGPADPGPGLVLARTDGSNARLVDAPGYELGRVGESIWAPDSHAVAWVRWTQDRQPTLMVLDVEAGDPRRIDLGPGVKPHLVWSPDNSHLAYVDWAQCEDTTSPHLYVVDTIAGDFVEIGLGADLNSLPTWSHDGARLAAHVANPTVPTTPRADQTPDQIRGSCSAHVIPPAIVIWDGATGEMTTVPVSPTIAFNLRWSPDDADVLALTPTSLIRVPVDGSPAEELARLEGGGAFWSPDAQWLAWPESDGGMAETSSLWVMDVPGAGRRQVAREIESSGAEGWPLWSPDSEWIAFHRLDGSIWVVRPDGTDERLLVDASLAPDLTGVDW